MVTLAAFCNAYGMSIRVEAEGELDQLLALHRKDPGDAGRQAKVFTLP